MYCFQHDCDTTQGFLGKKIDPQRARDGFVPKGSHTGFHEFLLHANPLDDGMADILTMYSTDDILASTEGTIFNHCNDQSDAATGYILFNDKHGLHFVVCSDKKLGMKWSLTFCKQLKYTGASGVQI